MNKQERKLKGQAKFNKRLKNYGITQEVFINGTSYTNRGVQVNFNCYRTTGKPCSCAGCSPGKVEEKAKYRLNKFNKNKMDE
jgi:hypothetical protein